MGKFTISMAMFNSYVKLPEGNNIHTILITHFVEALWSEQQQSDVQKNP